MTETTPIRADDLQLSIDNDRDLYDKIWTPIATELTRKKDAGTYDHSEAVPTFMFLVSDGRFEEPMQRLAAATKEQCQKLTY